MFGVLLRIGPTVYLQLYDYEHRPGRSLLAGGPLPRTDPRRTARSTALNRTSTADLTPAPTARKSPEELASHL